MVKSSIFGVVILVLLIVGIILVGLGKCARIAGIGSRLDLNFGASSGYQSHNALYIIRKCAVD